MEGEDLALGSQELSGYFKLKRKLFWARRFIVIKSGILYYYKNPTSTIPRGIYHMLGKKVLKDAKDLTLEIQKENSEPLRIQFPSASEFNLWYQHLLISTNSGKGLSQPCAFEELQKISDSENQKLVSQIPQTKLLPGIKAKIEEIKTRQYNLVGCRGPSLLSCTSQSPSKKEVRKIDMKLWVVGFLIATLVFQEIFGNILTVLGLATIAMFIYFGGVMIKDEPTVEAKVHFKNSVLFKAGVGEVLTALFDTMCRTAWDPFLIDAVEGSSIKLTYHFQCSTHIQDMNRTLVREGSYFYLLEKTGQDIKNLFVIESKDKKGQLLTLITHYGCTDSGLSPLTGSPDTLTCLKVFVESNTVYVNTNQITEVDKSSDEEDHSEHNSVLDTDPNSSLNHEAAKVLKEAEDFLNSKDGWEPLKLSSSLVKGYRKKVGAGYFVVRGEGEINRTPSEILEALQDLSRKSAYDTSFESGHNIEILDPSMEIVYQKYKGKLGVSARDFCLLQKRFDLPDGKVVALATSINHAKCPETKFVRAHLYFGCHFLTPIGPRTTMDVYMIYVDIRGNVPKFLANTVQVEQAMLVDNLRNFLS